jgi:arylsulfatase A
MNSAKASIARGVKEAHSPGVFCARGILIMTVVYYLIGIFCWLASVVATSAAPNFVIIMADDLGYGDLSAYGGWIETPHLDRMAKEGMRFTDFHSNGNVCSPTRAALLTGRYQHRAGIPGVVYAQENKDVHYHGLQAVENTFAEVLREAGYRTALFGKWHLGYYPRYNPVNHGFDEFVGYVSGNVDFISHVDGGLRFDWWEGLEMSREEGYTTHLITRHGVDFIKANAGAPFCLYLPHEAPHSPYQGPGDPPVREVGRKTGKEVKGDEIKRAYREMVQEMDEGIGEILDTLREAGVAENTLVFFCSDNGATSSGSNGALRGQKGTDWEGGHRVPAIAWWPGKIEPGTTTDQLAISFDLMPTMLELAGLAAPADRPLDGESLVPVLLEGKGIGPRRLIWNGAAVRDGNWKLVIEKGEPLLFDLANDPGEEKDLADRHVERVARMMSTLKEWTREMEETATPQPDRSSLQESR